MDLNHINTGLQSAPPTTRIHVITWCARQDMNLHTSINLYALLLSYERNKLGAGRESRTHVCYLEGSRPAIERYPHNLEQPAGFEPAIFALARQRRSTRPWLHELGCRSRIRTGVLLGMNQARLSTSPICCNLCRLRRNRPFACFCGVAPPRGSPAPQDLHWRPIQSFAG